MALSFAVSMRMLLDLFQVMNPTCVILYFPIFLPKTHHRVVNCVVSNHNAFYVGEDFTPRRGLFGELFVLPLFCISAAIDNGARRGRRTRSILVNLYRIYIEFI